MTDTITLTATDSDGNETPVNNRAQADKITYINENKLREIIREVAREVCLSLLGEVLADSDHKRPPIDYDLLRSTVTTEHLD